ncbi:MAG: ATP-binding protein, partial [Thermoplasmatales archaeon]|nr:ATP-binding protein [Thermoplasmatales archaeon]
MKITVSNRIMLHLLEYRCIDEYEPTYHATQHGIAESAGMLRKHVPIFVKNLIQKKIVKESVYHVKGLERKRKVYKLTTEGIFHAEDIREKIMNTKIRFRDKKGEIKEMKICDVMEKLKKTEISILDIAIHTKDGILDYKDLARKGKPVDFTENAPRPIHFYGREKEIQALKNYLKEDRKIVAVYGMPGIGKTALLSKIIEEYKGGKNIFYYNIHEWDTLRSILEPFSDFLQRMGERKLRYYLKSKPEITMSEIGIILDGELKNCKNTMIVFDDTQKANKEIISLFEYLREILLKTDTNLIVAGRKKPGFYDARHILHKTIGEIKLDGLDKESSRKLVDEKTKLKGLDKNSSEKLAGKKMLDEDIFEKIYSYTKGHPMALELIGTGKGLEKTRDVMKYVYNEVFSRLITQEKDLMFFLSVFNRPVPVDMLLQNNFSYE